MQTGRKAKQQGVQSKPPRKYIFTKSSSGLPQPSSSQLIKNKKIFQTMIKQELKKLQQLNRNVEDPEIEPFVVEPNKNEIDQKLFIKAKKLKIGNQNDNENRDLKMKEDLEKYMEGAIDEKKVRNIQKIAKKYICKQLFRKLKSNKMKAKIQKAVRYHNYLSTIKKCFKILKSPIIKAQKESRQLQKNEEQLQKSLFSKNYQRFLTRLKNEAFRNRFQVYKKIKLYNNHKKTVSFLINKFRITKLLKLKEKMVTDVKKRKVIFMMKVYRKQKGSFCRSQQMLSKIRRHRLVLEYVGKAKLAVQLKKYVKISLKDQLNNKKINQFNEKIKYIFGESQITQNIFRNVENIKECQENYKKIISFIQKNSKLIFLKLIRSHRNIQFIKQNENKNCSKKQVTNFFNYLKDSTSIHTKKIKLVKLIKKKFIERIIKNTNEDLQFNEGIVKCLKGSRSWLIKNKQLFKAQPSNGSNSNSILSIISNNPKNTKLMAQFSHPLSNKNLKQLLEEQSKYKNVPELAAKRAFIEGLKKKRTRNKRKNIMRQTCTLLHSQNLIKKVWNTLASPETIKNIVQEIQQEILAEQDQQAIKIQQKAEQIVFKLKKKRIFEIMKSMLLFKNKIANLKQQRENRLVSRINRQISNVRQMIKQKKTFREKLNKLKLLHKNQIFSNISKGLQQNKNFKLQQRELLHRLGQPQQSVVNSLKYKNLSEKIVKIYKQQISNKRIQQFTNLLEKQRKINRGSIEVTTLYLKNKIKKFHQICNKQNKIYENIQCLISSLRNKKIVQSLRKWKSLNMKRNEEHQKQNQLQQNMRKKLKITIVKSLMKYSTNRLNKEISKKASFKLLKTAKVNKIKQFLSNLRQSYNYLKKRKQLKQIQQKEKIPKSLQENKNLTENNKIEKLGQQKFQDEIEEKQNKYSQERLDHVTQKKQKIKFENSDSPQKIKESNVLNQSEQNWNKYMESSGSKKSSFYESSEANQNQFSPIRNNGLDNDLKQSQTSENISYEEYRKSLMQNNFRELKESIENQNSFQNQSESHKGEHSSQFQNKYHQNSPEQLWQDKLFNNKNGNEQKKKNPKQHNNRFSSQKLNLNAKQQQTKNSRLSEASEMSQNSQIFANDYLENRYNTNLTSKYFNIWKAQNQFHKKKSKNSGNLIILQKSSKVPQESNLEERQEKNKIMQVIFEGWKMFSRQKILVKKYLKQYQEQLYHYYPHSKDEYQEFKNIVNIGSSN